MQKFSKVLGGILLIAGTTIGAGILALPIVTGFAGFLPSLVLLVGIWAVMLCTALFFLDVNLAIKGEPNLISMASRMLGPWGRAVSWIFYLLLLYALLAAYISGSSSILVGIIHGITGFELPNWISPFTLPLLFGGFIYLGTKGVDYVNRILIIGLVITYFMLISLVPSCSDVALLKYENWPALAMAVTVVTTSFGYHIIIPSLTTYMEHDRKLLRITVIVGSCIPLLIYVMWQFVVLGVVPLDQIQSAFKQGLAGTEPLANITKNPWIMTTAKAFSVFSIVTSFLGVSLSLSDFLTDGFSLKKSWEGRLIAISLTFLPPLFFVYAYERGFYLALQYGGVFVAVLLIFLPAIMAWHLHTSKFYRSIGGRILLLFVMLVAFGIIAINILEAKGLFGRFYQ